MKILESSRTFNRKSQFLSAVKNPKLRILEVTTYTLGVCGVATRVLAEAELLARQGHEVRIFSTNHVKGSPQATAPAIEQRGIVKIQRFPAMKIAGESYTVWNPWKIGINPLEKEIIKYKPDVIISHAYRHTHTLIAYRAAKKIGAKSILVTHAPFGDNPLRSPLARWYIPHFDTHQGKKSLKEYDKIIAITQWELPYLQKLGVSQDKITYLPNGIPERFFTQKPLKENPHKILFFGRIAPVKDIETLIRAFALLKNKTATLELAGPAETPYLARLQSLIHSLKLESLVSFTPAIYDINKKIKKIDSAHIFVLPSKREGMPQSLIEAMTRKKIVIASDTLGAKDILINKRNGFLFHIGDAQALASAIDTALALSPPQKRSLQNAAYASVKQFAWNKLIKKLEKLLIQLTKEAKNNVRISH